VNPVAVFRFSRTEGPGHFATFLEANRVPWTLVKLDQGEHVPETAEGFSGLGFMGGPMSANDDLPWTAPVLNIMRDAVQREVPVIGHCLGGQLLSRSLGGEVTRNPVKEIGWNRIHAEDTPLAREWLGDLKDFITFQWHGETFSIPARAQRILSGPHCPNQAYVVDDRHLGMQCHVEVTAEIIASWCELGWEEIEENLDSPCVMPVEKIKALMPERLAPLGSAAERLYTRWLKGVKA
jgi:GMP synthase-like glutamine amidotransferase